MFVSALLCASVFRFVVPYQVISASVVTKACGRQQPTFARHLSVVDCPRLVAANKQDFLYSGGSLGREWEAFLEQPRWEETFEAYPVGGIKAALLDPAMGTYVCLSLPLDPSLLQHILSRHNHNGGGSSHPFGTLVASLTVAGLVKPSRIYVGLIEHSILPTVVIESHIGSLLQVAFTIHLLTGDIYHARQTQRLNPQTFHQAW